MKTVLLLGGPAAGQRVEVHGTMTTWFHNASAEYYRVVPMCSHGAVHWFGVLDGAGPLALLIAGYAPGAKNGRMAGMHPALGMGYGDPAPVRGDIYAEVAKDFSPTKNRDGECP